MQRGMRSQGGGRIINLNVSTGMRLELLEIKFKEGGLRREKWAVDEGIGFKC